MTKPLLAVIVGSNRRESINRKLAQAMIKLGADKFDARIVRIDDLPMFNHDNEGNLPPEVVRFKDELARADGVLIVTPEHDRSIPAVLKNAVDWGARPWGKNSWAGKPGFITGTSPGAIGYRRVAPAPRRLTGAQTPKNAEIPARLPRSICVPGRAAHARARTLGGVNTAQPLVPAKTGTQLFAIILDSRCRGNER